MQQNGSGIPVVCSSIYKVQILNDSIILLNEDQSNNLKIVFTYSASSGLQMEGKKLKQMHNSPLNYVWTADGKIRDKPIDLRFTKYSLKKNEVYLDEKVFKIPH